MEFSKQKNPVLTKAAGFAIPIPERMGVHVITLYVCKNVSKNFADCLQVHVIQLTTGYFPVDSQFPPHSTSW